MRDERRPTLDSLVLRVTEDVGAVQEVSKEEPAVHKPTWEQ